MNKALVDKKTYYDRKVSEKKLHLILAAEFVLPSNTIIILRGMLDHCSYTPRILSEGQVPCRVLY